MQEILIVNRLTAKNQPPVAFNPTCFDKKIHIRLRDFQLGDMISGFESKLIFIVECFLHEFIRNFPAYAVDKNMNDDSSEIKQYIFSKYVNEFKQSSNYRKIVDELKKVITFDDIIIKPVYSKKQKTSKFTQFGEIDDQLRNIVENNLPDILNGKTITDFLFNDLIALVIAESVNSNPNEKYINKNAKALAKEVHSVHGYQQTQLRNIQ